MTIVIASWLVFAALFVTGVTIWIAHIGLNFEFTSVVLQAICVFMIGGGVLTVISILGILKEFMDISRDQT
jgi:hypothetical protein